MKKSTSPLDYLNALDRYKFLTILNAGNENEEHQFVKQACMLWLVNYPGDIYVQYQQALNFANLGKPEQAVSILKSLIELDPQFIEAYQSLSGLNEDSEVKNETEAIIAYLTEETQPSGLADDWLNPLWEARQAYTSGDLAKTTELIHQSLLKITRFPFARYPAPQSRLSGKECRNAR